MLKVFKCPQCGSTFDRASQLDYHHRSIHLGERSQICQICGKGFFRKADLRTHLNIHLGTNFYICEVCGRKFSHISNLIRHCRMHTGIKPYSCSICEKHFTQISSLARHKQMIHGIPKDVIQQYCKPSLINNKSQTSDHTVKEKEVDKIKNEYHETFSMETKTGQNIVKGSDIKSEIISNQHNTDMDNKALETVIYIASKQFEENNLAESESTNRSSQDYFAEIEERLGFTGLPMNKIVIFNSRDTVNNQERIQSKDNINCLHQFDKSDFTFLPRDRGPNAELEIQNDEDILRSSDTEICIAQECKKTSTNETRNSLNIGVNLQNYDCNKDSNQKLLHKQMCKEIIDENRKCNKLLSDDDNQLYIQLSDSEILKFDETQYCNNIDSTDLNHVSKSQHSENTVNDIICTPVTMQNQNLLHNEETLDNFNNSNNIVLNNDEPMLRLVQTETGEQFYEFIISNLVDKMQNASCIKDLENAMEETSDTFRDSQKLNSNPKENNDKSDHLEQQTLESFTDINNEFSYTQFDFHREEKNFNVPCHGESEHFQQNSKDDECGNDVQRKSMQIYNSENLELLENESHVDFETNLEVFERLNYENCNEKFLEFVEVSDIGIESAGYKESSIVRLIQNNGEQLFELLQDSQIAEQDPNQDFIQVGNLNKDCLNVLQNSNKIADCPKNKSDFFAYIEDNVPLEENINNNRDVENNQRHVDSDNNLYTDVTIIESVSNENCVKTLEAPKKLKTTSKKFLCLVCKKAFSTAYNYKQHIGIHFIDQQKFHCKDCGMSFAWKSTLNKHIANNHNSDGPQKFVCKMCPKIYSTLSQVNEHVKRDHLKQRNHVCIYCGKSFFKRFDLKTHSRTHTNERPYVCRICGKRFHHQSHIIRHERTHSSERPYVCDICQKTFTQPSSLKAHKQKHQQIRMNILDYQIDEDDPIVLAAL